MPHTQVSKIQKGRAKKLRRNMTRAETLLWRHLKAHRVAGLSFRRQAPMGPFIADFVSHMSKLVIEIDGESHDFEDRFCADQRRDAWFASRGYRVLRFTNDDVLGNLEGVVTAIGEGAARPPPCPSPASGGGNSPSGTGTRGVLS